MTPRHPASSIILLLLRALCLTGLAGGCSSSPDPTRLSMLEGTEGHRLDWNELVGRSLEADVIVVGEEHDDATAHAFQLALVSDIVALDEGTALSLEMLERPEQPIVDEWLNGELTTDEMIDRTESRNWAGKDSWIRFYQPILETARAAGSPIVAANAPRHRVRRARIDGYEVLRELPPEERAEFDLPETLEQGGYWERFRDTMREFRGDDVPEAEILATFRSQMVWDTTMAASIATALGRPDVDRVIHLVGRFHGDFEGGTVRELRRLVPGVRVLNISCVGQGEGMTLDEGDVGRADVVVHTLKDVD